MVRNRHSAHVEGLTAVAALHDVRWPQHQRSWLPHGRQISVTAYHPHVYAGSLHVVHLLTSHYNARSALHTRLISPAGVSKAGRHLARSCTTSIAHQPIMTCLFSHSLTQNVESPHYRNLQEGFTNIHAVPVTLILVSATRATAPELH